MSQPDKDDVYSLLCADPSLTSKEISTILSLPHGEVKKEISLIIKQLKARLEAITKHH